MHTERVQACASLRARQSTYSFRCDRLILLAIAIFGASLALADPETKKTSFDIAAQPAKTSLTLYARQARVQLGFAADVVDDVLTNAVKGEYENAQALEILLEGTGLEGEQGERGIIIRLASEGELTSGIEEPAPAIADENGLQFTQTGAQSPSHTATSRESNASGEDDDESITTREEIVVTGSRIRGAQSASPMVTVSRQEIAQSGFATVEELVDKLPQNYGAGASLDISTDFANTTNVVGGRVDDRAGGTSINLRGLGASSTLILVNGRRISPGGHTARFTNISSIPLTAIERVEVLTDGASAIYGSDAIAGVVNFILRDDYHGAETRLRYGVGAGGVKPEVLLGQSFGISWNDGGALLTYEYYDSENLANSDRDITSTNDLRRFGGADWRLPGGNPGNISAGGQLWAIPAGQDGTSLTAADFDLNAPLNLYNDRSVGDVIPALERHSAFLHLTQSIGKAKLFADAQFSTQERHTRTNFGTFDITVPDTNPFFVDPTGTGLTTVTIANYSVEDDIGPSPSYGEIDSFGTTLGVHLDISENWNGELTGSWSKEKATSGNKLTFNDGFFDSLGESDPEFAYNPFGDGSNTNPALLESILDRSREERNKSENDLWGLSLNIGGELFDLTSGALQIASGIEFREESLFSQRLNPTSQTADTSRDVLAVYTELFFPLVGSENNRRGLHRLELSLAGRYEDYSDFGSSTNPKVGIVWSPTQELALRGTYGTSFRAPALFDLDVTIPGANFAIYIPQAFVDLGLVPFPFISRAGGNEDLQAEEATTWTAGFQWSPSRIKGMLLDVTYFNIEFEDRIDLSGATFVTGSNDPRFATLFNTNPTPEQIAALVNDPTWVESFAGFTTTPEDILSGDSPVGAILDLRKRNLAKSVTTGVELQLSYDFDTALGAFNMGLNANYIFDFEQRIIATDPLVDEVDTLGRPVDFRTRASVTWSHREWSMSGFVDYMDGYTDNVSDPARPIDSWTTLDLTIAYSTGADAGLLSDTRLSLTTQNVFDEDPPFVDTFGGLAYDSANGNPLGRFIAFQATKHW